MKKSGRIGWRPWGAVVAAALALLPFGTAQGAASGTWSVTGSMHIPRTYETATTLPNGTVLVTGGYYFTFTPTVSPVDLPYAELYNPASGTWFFTRSMSTARHSQTATLLPNGNVLVAGGCCDASGNVLSSAELYDPATFTWRSTGSMGTAREDQTATVLPSSGKVLVAGGSDSNGNALASAELYDPATGTWSAAGAMHAARQDFTATLLPSGKVLAAGGEACFVCRGVNTAEVYDPTSNTWSTTASPMAAVHVFHSATLLPNGKVLIAGGCATGGFCAPATSPQDVESAADLYDPATNTFTATASMLTPRFWHSATLLASGKVLVAGGETVGRVSTAAAELYDPVAGTWSATGSLKVPVQNHAAVSLANGQVLVVGGFYNGTFPVKIAQVYQP